jgi:hypothetical protein
VGSKAEPAGALEVVCGAGSSGGRREVVKDTDGRLSPSADRLAVPVPMKMGVLRGGRETDTMDTSSSSDSGAVSNDGTGAGAGDDDTASDRRDGGGGEVAEERDAGDNDASAASDVDVGDIHRVSSRDMINSSTKMIFRPTSAPRTVKADGSSLRRTYSADTTLDRWLRLIRRRRMSSLDSIRVINGEVSYKGKGEPDKTGGVCVWPAMLGGVRMAAATPSFAKPL